MNRTLSNWLRERVAQQKERVAAPAQFKVVLAHDGRPTHSWTFGVGERMIITDPLIASLVTSGYWSIEVQPA